MPLATVIPWPKSHRPILGTVPAEKGALNHVPLVNIVTDDDMIADIDTVATDGLSLMDEENSVIGQHMIVRNTSGHSVG